MKPMGGGRPGTLGGGMFGLGSRAAPLVCCAVGCGVSPFALNEPLRLDMMGEEDMTSTGLLLLFMLYDTGMIMVEAGRLASFFTKANY